MSQSPESTPTAPSKELPDAALKPEAGPSMPDTPSSSAGAAGLSREALELEVSQVLGSFNSWWGGVKKQSAFAISTIQADLAKTVKQAQTDLEHLKSTQVEVVAKTNEQAAAEGSFLDRLPVAQIQQTLQTAYSNASANPAVTNVNQLRIHLAERLSSANLDLPVKQAEKMAEDFLRKGEQWRKDAGEWVAGAVKVVPPEFDRPDLGVGSRHAALLAKLQQDKEALLEEPSGDFDEWIKANKVEKEDEEAVGAMRMALVPEHLTDEQFWQRYSYRKHLIKQEDTRRQQIIQESQQQQEEFNWDDEEEPKEETRPAVQLKTSTATSPRDSEESYDVVSEQGRKNGDVDQGRKKVEDEDSDWE